MIIALLLLAYAALLAVAGPYVVRRARWVERAPRSGIIAWQVLSLAFIGSLVMGGLALSVPDLRVGTDLAELLQACLVALRAQYATPGGAVIGISGVGLALLVLLRCGWRVAVTLWRAIADRRRHLAALRLLARQDGRLGAVVLDHAVPAAYCLPGLRQRIVLTSGALAVLSDEQLQAVLAHERAHLRARHDLVAAFAAGLTSAFPRLRLFTAIRDETARLMELAADDSAARSTHRLVAAEALLNVASQQNPAGAFAAGGSGTGDRVRRLISGVTPFGRMRLAITGGATAALLAVPLAIFAGPAATLLDTACCPTGPFAPSHVQVCQAMPTVRNCPPN
ncbi:Zn-dependent protease with chaperone function [Spinactinospora alkalitolerans]|uniref:Zn-dependent protease with chaperone function n=1 Tax=Spinactinospora alkalitolerans TaxID=687207 RepID=A0A852U085_9ACTN|nr:M56 family metallopeptidase [Spinactinospora alkalitolerans]NYE49501.1 Zn-dependent protease with chaperone function [Spinactinospora alkalitolerans]